MINMGQLLGRVGSIDTNQTKTGITVTNISMATSKKFTKDGEKQEKVTWHNVTLFSKLSEIAQKYVAVGDLLYIQGEMDNHKFVDTNGVSRVKSFLVAHELKMMPKAKTGNDKSQEKNVPFCDDAIPF